MMPWKTFVARLGLCSLVGGSTLVLAVSLGIRLAGADPAGPPTRHALTIAGTLSGLPASPAPALVFVFRKMGSECRTTGTAVRYDGAHFSAEIPIDGSPCRAFFDGADATVDVEVNGARVVTGAAVNPVPYARFADTAGGRIGTPTGSPRRAPTRLELRANFRVDRISFMRSDPTPRGATRGLGGRRRAR